MIHRNRHLIGYVSFLVMYDINSTMIRNRLVKYLVDKGCYRIQKSIFMANLPISQYKQITHELLHGNYYEDTMDSICILPVSMPNINEMTIIGKQINLDMILKTTNTLFF